MADPCPPSSRSPHLQAWIPPLDRGHRGSNPLRDGNHRASSVHMDSDAAHAPISLTMASSTPNHEQAVQRTSSIGRLPALDGIRGLAIIWVVLRSEEHTSE